MGVEIALMIFVPFVAAALLTALVRKLALSGGVLDVPNERSSHETPTARGGGIAIVVTSIVSWLVLALSGKLQMDLFLALSVGGLGVAIVGWLDDRHRLSAGIRLSVHVGAALWALACLGGLPPFQLGGHIVSLGWAGYVVGTIGIVWVLNLFNFMDGIDGIAASEAVFIAWSGALLAVVTGTGGGVFTGTIVLGAACLGFLLWNWPPAKIFMGDVGSGYLGYVIAVLALGATRESPPSLLAWLLLGGLFFVDATITVARRIVRGERVQVAHRSHAYQWLARRWRSHARVTIVVLLVNLLWLLPWAWVATAAGSKTVWIVAAAFGPVAIALLIAGAGRREQPPK